MLLIWGLLLNFVCTSSALNNPRSVQEEANLFLKDYNYRAPLYLNHDAKASWNYQTNLTEYNQNVSLAAQDKFQLFMESMSNKAAKFDLNELDYDSKRQIKSIRFVNLEDDRRHRLNTILSDMSAIYGYGKVCDETGKCLPLDPDLQFIMGSSRNASELLRAWEGWHNNVGRELKPLYLEYISLKNELSKLNGYHDYGELWRDKYETESFEDDIDRLWEEIKPYYLELHAYVRRKLYETYGPEHIDLKGPIPQHLLGDMWGRFWNYIYPIVQPYETGVSVDPTQELIAQNYTTLRLFKTAEEFYTSLGLLPLPSSFFKFSLLDRPDDREVLCHPTAWDMFDGKDFRIKMCTEIDFEYFRTIHHEMGHTQYQMQYAHQPVNYRDGANDGFHEAIGEVMSMSVSTPTHLAAIGLVPEVVIDNETDINFLLLQSLTSLSTIPFHYVMDKVRWGMFRGDWSEKDWNKEFWRMTNDVMGVASPVNRDDELDLDVTTIFHVCNDYDMIRYFTRTILQFQFSNALCTAAKFEGPLHHCDIYRSKEAGSLLKTMMQMGNSRPWPEALQVLTGHSEMSSEPLKRYFKPLFEWLRVTNKRNGDYIGWNDVGK